MKTLIKLMTVLVSQKMKVILTKIKMVLINKQKKKNKKKLKKKLKEKLNSKKLKKKLKMLIKIIKIQTLQKQEKKLKN